MAEPIIFDDGGSTRIKHARANNQGNMDGLMDVTVVNGVPQSQHTFPQGQGPFTVLRVGFIDRVTGAHMPIPTQALSPGDMVEITSGVLTARLTIGPGNNPAGTLLLIGAAVTLGGNPVLVEPQMEARQAKGKRRYIVSNAPPIDTVTYTSNAGVVVPIFPPAGADSIYTIVHIR